MLVNRSEIINAVSIITENHDIKVCVTSSLKATAYVAGSTLLGSILLGDKGILIGAGAGSLFAYCNSRGTFKSAASIIRDELSEDQKEMLLRHIKDAFKSFAFEDAAALLVFFQANRETVVDAVIDFFTHDMKMQIID